MSAYELSFVFQRTLNDGTAWLLLAGLSLLSALLYMRRIHHVPHATVYSVLSVLGHWLVSFVVWSTVYLLGTLTLRYLVTVAWYAGFMSLGLIAIFVFSLAMAKYSRG